MSRNKQSQADRVWGRLIARGEVFNFDCVDNKLDGKGHILRLGDVVLKLRRKYGQDSILTDFGEQYANNCRYYLNQMSYKKVIINGGINSYWEKI